MDSGVLRMEFGVWLVEVCEDPDRQRSKDILMMEAYSPGVEAHVQTKHFKTTMVEVVNGAITTGCELPPPARSISQDKLVASWKELLLAPPDVRLTIDPPKAVLQTVYEKLQSSSSKILPLEVCLMIDTMVLQSFVGASSDDGQDISLLIDILVLLFVPQQHEHDPTKRSRKETQQRLRPFVDPCLIRVWKDYPDSVTQLLTQAVKCHLIEQNDSLQQQVCAGILQQIQRLQQGNDASSSNDGDELMPPLIGYLLQLIKQVSKVVPPLVPEDHRCSLWDDAAVLSFVLSHAEKYPDDCARILWNAAIAAPTLVAQEAATWTYIRSHTTIEEDESSSIVAAIVGNLVSGAPDYLLVPQYPWLTPLLCEQLLAGTASRTTSQDATLRRIVRTLRCMGPDKVVQYAPDLCLRALMAALPPHRTTRTMLVCQTLATVLPLAPNEQRRLHCPALQLRLIDHMVLTAPTEGESSSHAPAEDPNTMTAIGDCLLATVTASPWTTSLSCFPEALFEQLLRGRSDATLAATADALVSHLIQLPTADTFVSQSPALLELLCRRLHKSTHATTKTTTVEQLTRIATPTALPRLAANEHVLRALVDVCHTTTHGGTTTTEAAKQLVLRLIPEL